MLGVKTPFDRIKEDEVPLLKIVVHTDSFLEELLNEHKGICNLIELSKISFLNILFTPSGNLKVKDIFKEKGVTLPEYIETFSGHAITISYTKKKYNSYETIDYSGIKGIGFGHIVNYSQNLIPDSSIKRIDILLGHDYEYDYFVLNEKDPYFRSELKIDKDLSLNDVTDIIRLILVNNNIFFLTPHEQINEGFYYLYRYKRTFKSFQYLWSLVVFALKDKILENKISIQLESLSKRLGFICRALDKASFFDLKGANNDTQDNALYHFAYYIMLSTGIFDDLAWLIKYIYNIRIASLMELDLRTNNKKKFVDKILHYDEKLYRFIVIENNQNILKLYYAFRNILMHREFLKAIRYVDSFNNDEKNLFKITEEIYEIIVSLNLPKEEVGIYHLYSGYYLNLYKFLKLTFVLFSNFVNNILSLINVNTLLKTLGVEAHNMEAFIKETEEDTWKLFEWKEEPLYF